MNFLKNLFSKTKDIEQELEQNNENDSILTDVKSLMERAEKKAKSKKYIDALNDFNAVIEREPNSINAAHAYMGRSNIKRSLKDKIGAKEDFEYAGVLLRKLDKGLKANDKGRTKFNEGDFKSALKYFNEAISQKIEFDQTYHLRGLSKKYLGDYKGALLDFNRVIDTYPDYEEIFEIYYDRGKIKYHKLNDYEGALEDYNKALHLDPSNADVYNSRAMLKETLKDFEGAMLDYNKAIELKPSDAEIFFSRGILKFKIEDYHGAIEDINNVVKMGLNDDASISMFDTYSLRGGFKHIVKDYEGAIKDFSKAIELNPNDGKTYFERGEAWLELGNSNLAAEDKFMAIKLGYEEED